MIRKFLTGTTGSTSVNSSDSNIDKIELEVVSAKIVTNDTDFPFRSTRVSARSLNSHKQVLETQLKSDHVHLHSSFALQWFFKGI
jgi:hypothetical protein